MANNPLSPRESGTPRNGASAFAQDPASPQNRAPTLAALVGRDYRNELREYAESMRESSDLKAHIHDHWENMSKYADTFKGECGPFPFLLCLLVWPVHTCCCAAGEVIA